MLRSISLAVAATLIGQLLNFAVDIFIAGSFGTSWAADAYFLALVITVMVVELFVTAINAVFIPAYVEYKKSGPADAFFSTFLNATAILSVFACAALYLLAPPLIDFVAAGFTGEARSLATALTRIMLILVFTAPVAAYMSNRLNAHGRFFVPALGRSFNFVFIIAVLLAFKDAFGIFSLAVGYVIGSVVFIAALVLLFRTERLGYSLRLDAGQARLKETGVLLLPIFVSAAVNYCGILYERSIAAGLPEGSIAALSYAFKLVNVPSNLLIFGAMSVVLPAFSRFAVDGDMDGLAALLTKGMRLVSFVIVPTIAGMAILGRPLVGLLFERGAFTPASTALTSTALFYYVFGICGAASVMILSRVFLALKEIKTMSVLGIVVVALNVILLVIFTPAFGFIGIPLAFSATATVHLAAMLFVLRKKTGMDVIRPLLAPFSRHLAAALAMTGALLLLTAPLSGLFQMQTKYGVLAYIVLMSACGIIVYVALSFALRSDEADYMFEKASGAIRRFGQ
ncbi:MAG: murein biosynthesis integral membrane protein MurJ [Deltaproteobacteria bacterium]|nr:murein biosynthesis integral membrane protein MurJ [Deltaproteobacteria bacterium]